MPGDGRLGTRAAGPFPTGSARHSPFGSGRTDASAALNLNLQWNGGILVWHDPATGRPIVTLEAERQARAEAEAKVRELEQELRRLRDG